MLRRDGGATVPFELSIVNLVDDPTVSGFVVSGHDISPVACDPGGSRRGRLA